MSRRIKPGDVILFERGSLSGARAVVRALTAVWRNGGTDIGVTIEPYALPEHGWDLEALAGVAVFDGGERIDPRAWGSE